jgi:hypothetical protein
MRSVVWAYSRLDRCLSTKGAIAQAVDESKRFTDRIEEAIQEAEAQNGNGENWGSPGVSSRSQPVTGGHGVSTNAERKPAIPESTPAEASRRR